ncbi:MAG: peptidoglycan-binding domain-containing protein [Candidatus Udaeobacter sp.]
MKHFKFLALCFMAAVPATIHTAAGQGINPSVQTGSVRVAPSRAAPVARTVANTAIARPLGFTPRTFNTYAPRIIGQQGTNLRSNYSPVVRSLNPRLAAINAQRIARTGEQEDITLNPATRQTELRTLAAMRERRDFRNENATLATLNSQQHVTTRDPAQQPRSETRETPKDPERTNWRNRNDRSSFSDVFNRHRHEWHDRNWWHNHCDTIVFVNTGYYFLDGSYWYPAFGYDPLNSNYDYDGPTYTYGNLLPDEVIANVQTALQDAGYYFGQITGSLSFDTRAALANFQRDYGLEITGAIDEPTVETLGLSQTDSDFEADSVPQQSY